MKIFRESYQAKEKCNLGCEHNVTYNDVIEVTEVGRELHQQWYGHVDCGMMPVTWYADSDGVIYFREATWDGPSGFLTADTGEEFLGMRPHGHEVRKDLNGNLLDMWGEVVEHND